MLEIYPVEDKKEQERISKQCGQQFDADAMCYAAYVDDELAGACQFAIHGKRGYMLDISNVTGKDDREALFIMGRQTLNFIDLCGAHEACYTGEVRDEFLIKWIGFRKTETDGWFMDLNGFFEAPCKHDNAQQ